MKTILAALFLVGAVFAQTSGQSPAANTPGQASTPQQTDNLDDIRAQEEEGIKHVLVSQIEAWNRGDLEGFMAGYWHAPELTFFSGGNIYKGWQAALQRYQKTYKSAGKEMGTLEFQDLNIQLLGLQAAVVTGKWQLTLSDGKTPHGLFTLVFKRIEPGWKIVHDHTSSADEK